MLVDIQWRPADRQLRQFGLISFAVLPVAGWLWSGGNVVVSASLAAVGAVLAAAGVVRPKLLRWPFVALSVLAAPIGIAVSEIIVALIYFGLFLPIGIVFRLIGRDVLRRKLEGHKETYWEAKKKPASVADYYRQW